MPIIASRGAGSAAGFGFAGVNQYKIRYLVLATGGGGNYGPGS